MRIEFHMNTKREESNGKKQKNKNKNLQEIIYCRKKLNPINLPVFFYFNYKKKIKKKL